MKICLYTRRGQHNVSVGSIDDEIVIDLTSVGIQSLSAALDSDDPLGLLEKAAARSSTRIPLADVVLQAPVERQEIWAAGVTYLRSKTARMEESDFSASAYDRVYEADRPEIFFKGIAEKVVGPGQPVGIRGDAHWNVPEPELALVINSHGAIVGCTIGNDMSSRDIEGENLLYLTQAKVYDRSCAIGPCILLGAGESQIREWTIRIAITRSGQSVFSGETSIGNIRRDFPGLVTYLRRSQRFPYGVVLLTGTGIVPPDTFSLQNDDVIDIDVPRIGVLQNTVITV